MSSGKARKLTGALVLITVTAAAWACFGGARASAGDGVRVGSMELIENSEEYNRRRVVYTGEIVVEVLDRGDYSWITVNDDLYGKRPLHEYQELKGGNTGIGVYCRSDMLEDVNFVGSHRTLGDVIQVTGVFYQASPQHGGDLMIEAEEITVVREGRHIVSRRGVRGELLVAFILALVSLVLGFAWFSLRKRPGGTSIESTD